MPARAELIEALPASPGVVALFDAGQHCVLLAASGDVRAFTGKRVAALTSEHDTSTLQIRCLLCPSMFEAERAYLQFARSLMPQTCRSVTDRWRCWFLRVDPQRGRWAPASLEEAAADGSVFIGPMPEKHAPARLGELLDDVFDLCRYPVELTKAPRGKPCAYYEMGRCLAPCAGLEAFGSFAARFAQALDALESRAAVAAAIEAKMNTAASDMQFERAAELRAHYQRLSTRAGHSFEHIAPAPMWARLAVVPGNDGQAGLFAVRADGIAQIARVARRATPSDLEPLLELIGHCLTRRVEPPFERRGVEEMWLACRRLFRKRRAEVYLVPEEAVDPSRLLSSVRREPIAEEESDSESRTEQP